MIRKTAASMTALVLCLGMFTALPVSAQTTGPAREPGVSEHHRMMADMMKDVSHEMSEMTEQMSHGEVTPEQQKTWASAWSGCRR